MDTIPKLKILVFLLLSIPTLAFSQSAPTGYVDLAGWIKGTDGVYSRAFSDGNGTRATPTNATVTSTSTALVQTSKGITAMDIVKTANVNTARLGSAMVGLAKKAGPVGMTLTAAALVCDLTTICKDLAGNWSITSNDSLPDYPSTTATVGYYFVAGINSSPYRYPSPEVACSSAASKDKFWGNGFTGSGSGTGPAACTVTKTADGTTNKTSISYASGSCPEFYSSSGSSCVLNGAVPRSPTDTDWDAKKDKLNDDRVTPHLIEAGEDVPTGVPTITNTPKKVISEDTAVTKDQNGNSTGTKVTTTEAEIVDAASAESPGKAIVKETTTVTNYDINNTVINSTTSTSYASQPPPNNPADQITISFDDVPDDAIEHEDVDTELETPESWGDGFCPADETIDYHYGTLTFDFQPTCDFAIGVRPVLIFMASITALFIVAGVKTE
ncbi:hypothetical protein C8R26_11759 [Nitrosomonas oligotropha]|uniref:TspB protein n=1 Tax=Nitrosomonas oligotropha TaxID=42354 RepID=A0A2T5HY08_9PROT|nr:virulence factor TspB C-terminal domain-related protein [Nitrosomonas oligotropha]PTQ76466.1 hypothetical protein C8R26_11759 [Nitrosomonas oligotropha]